MSMCLVYARRLQFTRLRYELLSMRSKDSNGNNNNNNNSYNNTKMNLFEWIRKFSQKNSFLSIKDHRNDRDQRLDRTKCSMKSHQKNISIKLSRKKHYSLQNIGIVSVSQRKFVQQKFDLNQSSPNIQIDDDHNDGGENLENRNQIKRSNKLIRYCSSNGLATNRRHKFNQSLRRVGSFGSRLLGQSVLRSKSNSKTDTPIYTHSNGSDRIHLDDDGIAINSLHTSHCFYSDLYRELNETSQSMFDDQFWGDFHPKFLKFSTNRNETLFLTKKCHNKCNESGSICLIQSLTNRLLNQTIQYYNLIESNQIDCEERLRKFSIYLDGQNRSFGPIKNETFEKFSIKFGPTIESFRFVSRSKDFNSLFNNQISGMSIVSQTDYCGFKLISLFFIFHQSILLNHWMTTNLIEKHHYYHCSIFIVIIIEILTNSKH